MLFAACLLLLGSLYLQPACAQHPISWTNPGTGNWYEGDNWEFLFAPETLFDEAGVVNNGGTALVSTDVLDPAGIILGENAGNSGTLEIQPDGVLEVVGYLSYPANGSVTVGKDGIGHLVVSGGTLTAAELTCGGESGSSITLSHLSTLNVVDGAYPGYVWLSRWLRIIGPDVVFTVDGGGMIIESSNTLVAEITGASHSTIEVAGPAHLGGRLQVEFNGYTPLPTDTWDLVDATAISGGFSPVEIIDSPLGPALELAVRVVDGGSNGEIAQLFVANLPALLGRIGVSFEGRDPATPLDPADVAGLAGYAQANWHNAPHNISADFDGSVPFLQDESGAYTPVEFVYGFNDSWNSATSTATPDQKLMNGIQKINPNPNDNEATSYATARFEGLLPGSVYDVIAYLGNDGANAKGYARIGGTSYYLQQESGWSGSWIRSTLTTEPAPGGYPTANYVQFEGVVPDGSGAIEIEFKKLIEVPQLVNGFGVAGIQLVKTAGDWPILTDPPVITEDPQDVLATVGDEVTLTVGTDGPWTITWYRVGTPPVVVQSDPSTSYTFTTTAADKGTQFYAVATNPAGDSLPSGGATLSLDDPAPEQLVQGFLRVEHYADIPGVVVWPDFYNNAKVVNGTPDEVFFVPGPDLPESGLDHFGRIIQGWVRPDYSGNYHFFIRSDDRSELFVNPTGGSLASLPPIPSDFFNLVPDAFEIDCCDPFYEPGLDVATSVAFSLTGGDCYGFALVYKEGVGGDYAQVAWRESGDLTPAVLLTPIPVQNCFCYASPSGKRATITQHPQDTTADQFQTVTFTVEVETLPDPNAFTVQWTVNGADIPGAHGTSYTTPTLQPVHNGDVYRARVFTLVGELVSDPATLTVVLDTVPPDLVSAGAYPGDTQIGLSFSEPVNVLFPEPMFFTVDGVTVTGVEAVSADRDVVLLTVNSPPAAGAGVVVDPSAVWDRNGAELLNHTTTVQISDLSPGVLVADPGIPDPGTRDPLNDGRSVPLGGGGMYLEAGGSDIWYAADAGHFAYRTYSGPFSLRVRAQNLTGPNNWTKAGIMVRETLDAGSRHVMAVATRSEGVNGLHYQWRDATDAVSGSLPPEERVSPVPYPDAWLRIDRPDAQSNRFEVFLSPDGGATWEFWQEHTIPSPVLPETVYVGMAATAHNNDPGADPATTVLRSFGVTSTVSLRLLDMLYSGVGVEIRWEGNGELQSAPSIDGPWAGLGSTSSSYTFSLDPGAPTPPIFFRLRNGSDYSENMGGIFTFPVEPGTYHGVTHCLFHCFDGTNHDLSTLFSSQVLAGTTAWVWDSDDQEFQYSQSQLSGVWSVPLSLPPGLGFFVEPPVGSSTHHILVGGEVMNGSVSLDLLPGLNLVGSVVPRPGRIHTDLGCPVQDGDTVYTLSSEGPAWIGHCCTDLFGWVPEEPFIEVGEAFWIRKSSSTTWTQEFYANPP